MGELLLSVGGIYLLFYFLGKGNLFSYLTNKSKHLSDYITDADTSWEDDIFGCRWRSVNPATGLPMANCSNDVMGNPYGIDLNHDGGGWNHDD